MTPTPRQREAIESWDRGDVCVVAGPGSGKTYVLVERFKWLVLVKGIPVRRILAITFTEKAAANMRRRLVESFAPESPERKAVERAYISTIHGFCARLLRENAIAAAVDPEFRVLDEWEAAFDLKRAIEEALDHKYLSDPDSARRFLARFGSNDVHGSLFTLCEAIRAAGVSIEEATRPRLNFDAEASMHALVDARRRLAAMPMTGWSPEQRQAIEDILAAPDPLQVQFNLNSIKRNSPQRALLKEMREQLIPACQAALLLEQNAGNRQWFFDVLAEAGRLYRERKGAASALDFSDLEEGAIRLLEKTGGRLRGAFSYILMDEFQDTNQLQAKLVDLLRSRNNFFGVGDINQSIYGFRHADPTVFRAFREKTEADGGHVVPLFENFRSRPEILQAVKQIIQGADGIEEQDLVAGREFPPASEPCVEILAVQSEEGDDALSVEAQRVAVRIEQIAAERTSHWGISVLLRTSHQVRVFERALRERGVPCEVTEGRGYYDAREVNDLVCFLRVLLNPLDEISLAAVLRSPLAGVSDDSLWRMKQSSDSLTAGIAASADVKVKRFGELLERYRRDRDLTSLDRLLGRLLADTGYEAWLLQQTGGPHMAANVRKLIAMARRFHASGRSSLQEFVDRLEDLRRDQVRESEARPPEQTSDAVQLMTVHAAKGLEFPVVFLPAINRGGRRESEPVTFSARIGVGMRWRDPRTGKDEPDAVALAVAEEARANRRDESQRLFYVAMTRAAERLILSVSLGQVREWAVNLRKNLGIDFQQLAQAAGGQVASENAAPARANETTPPIWINRPAVLDQSDAAVSATSVALFAQCPRRYYLSRYLGFDQSHGSVEGENDPPERDEMDSSEFGRHVHGLLAGTIPRENAGNEALRLVANFENSELGRRAAAGDSVNRERAFLCALDARLLSGQIDLSFREGGETVLVDYKTDEVSAAEASARAADYELQLRLYALPIKPERAFLYFLRPNVPIEVSLDPKLLDAARRKVEELFQAQSRLAFPLHAGPHCYRCPHFRTTCPAKPEWK